MAGHIADAGNVSWTTPKHIVEAVREVFGGTIGVDPCWNPESLTEPELAVWLGIGDDGLEVDWCYPGAIPGTVYVNPPFGTCWYKPGIDGRVLTPKQYKNDLRLKDGWRKSTIKAWVQKCEKTHLDYNAEVIALIPASVDTAHWQAHIFKTASAVCFIKGRLKFGGGTGPAPMACAVVYWGTERTPFQKIFRPFGRVFVVDR